MRCSITASLFFLASAAFSSASPVSNADLAGFSNTCTEIDHMSPDTPSCVVAQMNESELAARGTVDDNALAKRDINFISPHRQRVLVVGFASHIITGANWLFTMWVNDATQGVNLWRSAVSTSTNLHQGDILPVGLRTISGSANQYRGAATFRAEGEVGTAQLVVTFTAEIFASAAETIVQSMITPPRATLAGLDLPITSWSFNDPTSQIGK